MHVTARTLLRDVTLLADKLDPDAVVDDALVTLLAGESATFHVRTTVAGAETDLAGPPVLRCANDDHLAEGATLADVGQRVRHLVEPKVRSM